MIEMLKKPVRALISFIKVSLFIIIILFCHLWYIIIHSVAPSLILFSPQDRHTLLLKIYRFLQSNFWTTFLLNFSVSFFLSAIYILFTFMFRKVITQLKCPPKSLFIKDPYLKVYTNIKCLLWLILKPKLNWK